MLNGTRIAVYLLEAFAESIRSLPTGVGLLHVPRPILPDTRRRLESLGTLTERPFSSKVLLPSVGYIGPVYSRSALCTIHSGAFSDGFFVRLKNFTAI